MENNKDDEEPLPKKKRRKTKEIKTQIPWTKLLLEDFIKEAMLTEDEKFVMRTRCAGWSQVKQSLELNVSTSTISNIINRCKTKYDNLSRQFPNKFPVRTVSKVEEAMDAVERTPEDNANLCKMCSKFNEDISALELINCMNDCHYRAKK